MTTALETWRSITMDPRIVGFFSGLFQRVGVRVLDTGEELTATHRGAQITFEPGIDERQVDYTVEIQSHQAERVAEHARRGEFDAQEQYRIISTLFTPATAAALKNPVLNSDVLRRMAGAEDVIHARLEPPEGWPDEAAAHTLRYANGKWTVTPGLPGTPGRPYALTTEDALAYQRHMLAVLRGTSIAEWLRFSAWYRAWRKRVSVTKPAA